MMKDHFWEDVRNQEIRVNVLFGDATASIIPAVRTRAILTLENAEAAFDLRQNIAQFSGPATIFDMMTTDSALEAEVREWVKTNDPAHSNVMGNFHVYSDVPNAPAGCGVFAKQMVVIIRDENTATYFKLRFAGHAAWL